jgi:hypothetical protein
MDDFQLVEGIIIRVQLSLSIWAWPVAGREMGRLFPV